MDQPKVSPTQTPASNTAPSSTPPQNIVVRVGGGALQRLLLWMGWLGFAVFFVLFLSQSLALKEYFDTTEGIEEKYHSGSKEARDKVAIISVDGVIVEGSGYVKKQIDRVREDKNVKAVVVRIDSPGGTITGSDYIHHHLTQLRKEKNIPLVASMGGIAASGGYYVAMAVGDQEKRIYAEPTTTTGSIGVIVPHYDLTGLLDKVGVKDDSIVSHPRKQLLTMTRSISDDDRKILQAYVDEAFGRFKEIVKSGRPAFQTAPETLDQLATGEVFTAVQAKRHGLVDELGFIEDAIDRAIQLAKLDKAKTRVVEYERTPSLLEIPWLVESRSETAPLRELFELSTPRAYYLATTLPALLTSRREN
jgi:protease-4